MFLRNIFWETKVPASFARVFPLLTAGFWETTLKMEMGNLSPRNLEFSSGLRAIWDKFAETWDTPGRPTPNMFLRNMFLENHRDFAAAFRADFPERRGLAMHSQPPQVPQSKKKLIELQTEASRATNNSTMERVTEQDPRLP